MATSNVSIANLALQKLGAGVIAALDENSRNARTINACFELLRDRELRANVWRFTITRKVLAPHATAPLFSFNYAFILPADCLRPIKPARLGLDWHIEDHLGQRAILTNDGDTLNLRYVKRVTDPTVFDPVFVEMLATKIAWHICETITQSNTKKDSLRDEYAFHRREARQMNAFEIPKNAEPVDEWLAARQTGQLVNTEWDEE